MVLYEEMWGCVSLIYMYHFLDTYQIYHPLQPQKIRGKNILKFVVQEEQTIHHGVCFLPEKHCFFLKFVKENTSKEIEIRW